MLHAVLGKAPGGKGLQKLQKTSCRALSRDRALALSAGKEGGHLLHVVSFVSTKVPLYFCSLCGCYSMYRFQGLKGRCRRRRQGRARVLDRLRSGLQPTRPWVVSSISRVQIQETGDVEHPCIEPPAPLEVSALLDDPDWDPMADLSD